MSKTSNFLLLLLYFHSIQISAAKSSLASNSTDFIKAECQATLYPPLCIRSLSVHSSTIQKSPKQLAQAALSVSLSRAQTVSTFISKLATTKGRLKQMEYRAVQDCMANMGNTVDQLSRSLGELRAMGRGSAWLKSNVESWLGTALTFENTCLDGFRSHVMDGIVKFAITKRVEDCARVTSIALALVQRYAEARH